MRYIAGTLCALMLAGPAAASVITISIDPAYGSSESTGAKATVDIGFAENGSDDWMSLTITNITLPALGGNLTAVGLELPAFIGSVAFAPGGTGSYFDELDLGVAIAPGHLSASGGYDVMITSDGSFEGGNPTGAPGPNGSETVTLNLGDTGLTPAQLLAAFDAYYAGLTTPYGVGRFQALTVGAGSDKVLGEVPEPATLAVLLAGAALLRCRRRL